MFKFKLILIRTIASFVFFCRSKDLSGSSGKFVVCTGSVGKTIIRRSLVTSLSAATDGNKFTTPETDYCNELGVLLALLDVKNFSFFSYFSWQQLFFKKPLKDNYIFIELGADFRLDIDWFLDKWSPYDVILTQGTEIPWTNQIDKVLASRIRLCQKVSGGKIYVSYQDKIHLRILKENKIPFVLIDHEQDIYSYPSELLINYCVKNSVPEFILFSKKRFARYKLGRGILFKDTYKVTPVCFAHFLNSLLSEESEEKILFMTEIRPANGNYEEVYKNLMPPLRLVDKIYFFGNKKVYLYLSKNLTNLIWIERRGVNKTVLDLHKKLKNDSVAVGIKVSSFYKLASLDELSI